MPANTAVYLHIYSSSLVHRVMTPPISPRIVGTSFTHLTKDFVPTQLPPTPKNTEGHLSVIVEPFTVPTDVLARIPKPHVWWFLAPLQNQTTEEQIRGSAIGGFSRQWLADYLKPLTQRAPTPRPQLIVGDGESFETAQSLGYRAAISPPPISDEYFAEPPASALKAIFSVPDEPNRYQELFLEALSLPEGSVVAHPNFPDTRSEGLAEITLGISLGRSPSREFPVLAAAHLAAGNTLISEPLFPLHGLEPGIDYFEITSPQELFHVTNHLARHPSSTRLMSYRGRRKAEYFRASTVWSTVLDQLDIP